MAAASAEGRQCGLDAAGAGRRAGLLWRGGRGQTGAEAGARTEARREPGRWQRRPEPSQLVAAGETEEEEEEAFKARAQTTHKQVQVGCRTASGSSRPGRRAGSLAMLIHLGNRC